MGFDNTPCTSFKYTKDENGNEFFGELNADNKMHGKAIEITSNGRIDIGYWNNGRYGIGPYIAIEKDGDFIKVGENYSDVDGGELKCR